MFKYFLLLALLMMNVIASADETVEVIIPEQEVMVWNNVDYATLKMLTADLSLWCKKKYKHNCGWHDVSTYLSVDRSTIYYEFQLNSVDDETAVYVVPSSSSENRKYKKSWVSSWKYPFNKKLPFSPSKK